MPITIQEIIASDTISQLVDKTNFNFDQLLLNGGGPAGPVGPKGQIGPAGGRGPKGTTWYEDTSTVAPGVTPIAVPPTATPLPGDYYLQFNGQVWEYVSTAWLATTVNLTGPTGPAGQSGGFGLDFGSPTVLTDKTAVYNGPIGTIGLGPTLENEGVPSVMIGGATEYTPNVDASIPLTPAFIIPNAVAGGLISEVASLMIHQKDATSKAIVFHGGRLRTASPSPATDGNPSNFDQTSINSLSNIAIGYDDKLILNVPKIATSPSTQADLIGLSVLTPTKSQEYVAGKAISFSTNNRPTEDLSGENSDFLISVGGNNKYVCTTGGSSNTTQLQQGGGFSVVTGSNSEVGAIQMLSGLINLTSSVGKNIQLNAGGSLKLNTTLGTNNAGLIELTSGIGGILGQVSNNGSITLSQSDSLATATGNINIINSSTAPNTVVGGDIYIKGNSQIYLQNAVTSDTEAPSIVIDYGYHDNNDPTKPLIPHTRFAGKSTWQRSNMNVTVYPDTGGGEPYQFNYLDSTLTNSARVFRKTGSQSLTDVIAGAKYERWVGGTAAQTNEPMHQITIMQGNEGSPNGYPITAPYEAYDNSLTLKVSDKDENKDYVTISKNKIGVAAPFVWKRSNEANSTNNSAPNSGANAESSGQTKKYGWNPRNSNSTPSRTAEGGMPTTADLNVPYIEIGMGQGFGPNGGGSYKDRKGFDRTFDFPLGQYPGQQIKVIMYNQAYDYKTLRNTGTVDHYEYYGDFALRIPQMRMQRPTGGTYTDWWASVATEPGASQLITLTLSAANGVLGTGKRLALELVWNGGYQKYTRGFPLNPGNNANASEVTIQYGWDISALSFAGVFTNGWNINQLDSGGSTTIPTTSPPVT